MRLFLKFIRNTYLVAVLAFAIQFPVFAHLSLVLDLKAFNILAHLFLGLELLFRFTLRLRDRLGLDLFYVRLRHAAKVVNGLLPLVGFLFVSKKIESRGIFEFWRRFDPGRLLRRWLLE